MKLYLITATFDEGNTHQTWGGSQADAAAARKAFLAEGAKRKDLSTYEVEVPTGKTDLLQFLNDYQGSASTLVAIRKLTAS
jgi:hypothetical protein